MLFRMLSIKKVNRGITLKGVTHVRVPRTSHSYEYMTQVVEAKQSSRESCVNDVIM